MSIDFSADRWERVRDSARAWWAGELDRPLIQLTMWGRDPGRLEPPIPARHFAAAYGAEVTPEAIVDRWDYNLSATEFLGDAFPTAWPNFGPGVLAACMGARMETDSNTVWFHVEKELPIGDLHLRYDPESAAAQRMKAICRAAIDRWQGTVQVGMTDMGGTLDVLSTFRPGADLLLDLYDAPEEVKRNTWDIHRGWWEAFEDIDSVLQPVNPGYTAWSPIFSEEPYYILQCDFCYMIGPDMFDEFVKPELAACCRRLKNAFYHLDGKGQLPHLDSLLSIPELRGIQWVPGDGAPPLTEWPEVYRKIRDAGKLIQLWGGPEVLDIVARQLGSAEGIVTFVGLPPARRAEGLEFLARYGAV